MALSHVQITTLLSLTLSLLLLAAATQVSGQNCGCAPDLCCSRWGCCGTGDDYCGQGCQSGPCSEKAIFLLAGQSNMVGLGGVGTKGWDHYIPPMCQADPRILRLNNETLWEEAHEPLHINISSKERCFHNDYNVGIGPGMAFANSLLKSDPTIGTIGLVPCAVAGTYLSWWTRGSCLYNTLLARAQAALKEGGTLRGLLWYQGESDTWELALVDAYEEKLKKFFNDFRSDVMSPSLPISQVALASSPNDGNYIDNIRNIQLNFNLSNVRCVDAKGLALNGDNLHLTTESQVKLGSMMAEAFLAYFD